MLISEESRSLFINKDPHANFLCRTMPGTFCIVTSFRIVPNSSGSFGIKSILCATLKPSFSYVML